MLNSFVSVLSKCESASGEGTKKIIKAALAELDETGQKLFKYAMDPFLVFGIKKYDAPLAFSHDDAGPEHFTNLLDLLAERKITGNAARDAVTAALSLYTARTAGYLARVLDKDLQAGFSADTYNSVFKESPVRVFDVMLADAHKTDEDFESQVYPCQADIKYDGERNIAFQLAAETNFAPAGSSYRSRSGKIAEHMTGLFDEELKRIRDYLGYDFVLDGERIASNYIETINAKKSGEEGEAGKKNMRFIAFFLMPLTDWIEQKTTITMRENRIALEEILRACQCQKIILSKGREVNDFEDMMNFTDEVTTPGYDGMANGQEGLILKTWDAVYEWDRTSTWVKVKKFFDIDCRCVSWEFGRKKNAKRMGRVNVVGYLEDGTRVEAGVGSGWTDKQRDDVMERWDSYWQYQTIVVKYQEISKGKNKEHPSLRFPTFTQRVRDDKTVEA